MLLLKKNNFFSKGLFFIGAPCILQTSDEALLRGLSVDCYHMWHIQVQLQLIHAIVYLIFCMGSIKGLACSLGRLFHFSCFCASFDAFASVIALISSRKIQFQFSH